MRDVDAVTSWFTNTWSTPRLAETESMVADVGSETVLAARGWGGGCKIDKAARWQAGGCKYIALEAAHLSTR